jgi:ribosomal protein S30
MLQPQAEQSKVTKGEFKAILKQKENRNVIPRTRILNPYKIRVICNIIKTNVFQNILRLNEN